MFVCRLEPIVLKYSGVDTGVDRRIIGETEPGLRAMRLTRQHGHDKVKLIMEVMEV